MKGSWFILQAKVISVQGQSKWLWNRTNFCVSYSGPCSFETLALQGFYESAHAHLKNWLYKVFMNLPGCCCYYYYCGPHWFETLALQGFYISARGNLYLKKASLQNILSMTYFLSISLDLDYNHMFCPYL